MIRIIPRWLKNYVIFYAMNQCPEGRLLCMDCSHDYCCPHGTN